MTKPLSILGISSALTFAILGLIYYPEIHEAFTHEKARSLNENSDEAQVEILISQGKAIQSLSIIKKYKDSMAKGDEKGQKWLNYLIKASESLNDTPQLIAIFNYYPRSLDQHEKSALLVANELIGQGDVENYELLRSGFKGHETASSVWFYLDSDKLILQGKNQEALDLLSSRYFEGKEDTGRLLRLALLNINDHPKIAWDFLDQALKKDPDNSDLRLYRARLLDTAGKKSQAFSEYLTSIKAHPLEPALRDQSIDFLIREGELSQASQLSSQSLNNPTNPSIWVKAIFLNKTYKPSSPLVQSRSIPKSDLINYLISLKSDEFWNEAKFKTLAVSPETLQNEQATFWLRILQNLKEGREKDALTLLNFNPFEKELWNPNLAFSLKRILTYRASKSLQINDEPETGNPSSQAKIPPFFAELNSLAQREKEESELKLSSENENLLNSKLGLAAPFLAAGWYEAALALYPDQKIPKGSSPWLAYSLTQAYAQNQGLKEAIFFAKEQEGTPQLNLLLAEFYIENKTPEKALPLLKELSQRQDEIGEKSAFLLALILVDQKQYDLAKSTVQDNTLLAKTTAGQEIMARIYLKENQPDLALKVYTEIVDKSIEAKSYLAKIAFQEKDYKRALDLTDELLKLNPDSVTLIENKKRILNELKK